MVREEELLFLRIFLWDVSSEGNDVAILTKTHDSDSFELVDIISVEDYIVEMDKDKSVSLLIKGLKNSFERFFDKELIEVKEFENYIRIKSIDEIISIELL